MDINPQIRAKNIVKVCQEDSQRELSHGRVKIYRKGSPHCSDFVPNNEVSLYDLAWDFVTKFVNWNM